jgi:hypothetical protein
MRRARIIGILIPGDKTLVSEGQLRQERRAATCLSGVPSDRDISSRQAY